MTLMKITLPDANGILETIPVPVRVWLGTKLFTIVEWLIGSDYEATLTLVPKHTAE